MTFFQNFLGVMYDCDIALHSSNTDLDRVEYLLLNISEYEETIRVMYGRVHEHTSPLTQCFEQLMQIVHNTVNSLNMLYRENEATELPSNNDNYGHREPFRSEPVTSGQAGRPRFNITEEQIVVLHERLGFRWTDIASLLHVSTRTLNRRCRENGMAVGQAENFSQIANDKLDKILEKHMYNRLMQYLEKLKILNNNQFGFRSSHTTTQAVMMITDKIKMAIERKYYACGIFLDLKKAFDAVDHEILLAKLKHGIRGTA